MKISSVRFIKGIVQDDDLMNDGIPQVAFVGRSNVGKSSLINALTNTKISRVSQEAGHTRELNFFLINDNTYFVDLPGYGFAKVSGAERNKLNNLIESYLFNRVYTQKKVIMIIDSNVGMTDKDVEMFNNLVSHGKDLIVALSKIDKLTQAEFHRNVSAVKKIIGDAKMVVFSSKSGKGVDELVNEILS
jgi:GTP-binding protein